MKLAEALALRADLQKRLAQVKQRALANAWFQEGEAPAEDPIVLRAQHERMVAELTDLVGRINRTNLAVQIASGQSITTALAERDGLQLRRNFLVELAQSVSTARARVTRTELRLVSAVPVADFQSEADRLARQFRELDTAIQSTNWNADLLD